MEREFTVRTNDYRRYHERKKYPAEIVFRHANRLYAGSLKDVSLGGAFIETFCMDQLCTKDIVTLSIPFSSGQRNVKRRGSILRLNHTGFGVKFI